MAKCPKLDYESNTIFFRTSDKYVCEVTGIKMDLDSPKVKYVCDAECGYEYEKCPVYQNR